MNISGSLRHTTEAGSTTVEAGVTISFLLLLIFGIVELGQTFCTYNTMLLAADEAGRYAMLHKRGPVNICDPQNQAPQCPTLSNTPLANCSAALARQILSAYQAPDIYVSVTEDQASIPGKITICASYSVNVLAPLFSLYGPVELIRQVTVPLI